jgi:16S rRNA (cytosine967-C5)-methyltransferase
LQAIRSGQSGTAALAAVDAGLRPGVQALLFQVLRQLGRADALRRQLAARTPPPAADALLCTALALGWNPDEAPYEAFTLVNQAVEAAKHHPATRAQASFINGCLRRFLR